ncbi:helix-turn-helix domain-containing protein [Abyssalbus ytuae]|uniref:AraC family transcriptional regulator n=1 Tax=Abyssalbus ytuae TaxID=2926907 RepID=A0A9E6ZJU8_9FLAO|nr:AraC family transcriptional regulator [Abyssalbus ytuae]UOB16952.1 AraC family transcriptional regulator [Abyssalbus ytuae]
MNFFFRFDPNVTLRAVLDEQLSKYNIDYIIKGLGEIEIKSNLNTEIQNKLVSGLEHYGIYAVSDHKSELVQRIKNAITQMVHESGEDKNFKASVYLAEKLGYSYTYLSALFSEVTYTSIENFIILKKIDYAKELIINSDLTLSEIAYKLNYSSVAHLSNQFKKTTGLTPRVFQNIIKRRKNPTIED